MKGDKRLLLVKFHINAKLHEIVPQMLDSFKDHEMAIYTMVPNSRYMVCKKSFFRKSSDPIFNYDFELRFDEQNDKPGFEVIFIFNKVPQNDEEAINSLLSGVNDYLGDLVSSD